MPLHCREIANSCHVIPMQAAKGHPENNDCLEGAQLLAGLRFGSWAGPAAEPTSSAVAGTSVAAPAIKTRSLQQALSSDEEQSDGAYSCPLGP